MKIFCKMTKMRNFYQIFGRILVLEGQVMYQFCFVPKMRNFVVQILSCLLIFQKGNFIKAGAADCRKPCYERRERSSHRDRRDAFVHVKRLDLLRLCVFEENIAFTKPPLFQVPVQRTTPTACQLSNFLFGFDFSGIIGFAY